MLFSRSMMTFSLAGLMLLAGCTRPSTSVPVPAPTPVATYTVAADTAAAPTDDGVPEVNVDDLPAVADSPAARKSQQPLQVDVIVDGLFGPIGMEVLADGTLLVAEEGTGQRDDSAGVTLIAPDGQVGRFLTGLPSTRDSGDLAGVPLVKLAPDGATLYIGNFGQGHVWVYPLTTQEQTDGIALPAQPLTSRDLLTAMVRLNNVMLINPFDMTFDATGIPVVSDASGNGLAKENADGTIRYIHRFERLPNPIKPTDPVEAVPTGITRVGEEYYVTLLGGCPYPLGSGQLVAVDEARHQRTVLDGLNMPIDVAHGLDASGPDGTLWILEFARFTPDADCFSGQGYQVETGRLSRLWPDGTLETVLDHLNFPGAVLPMPDGSLYISEVLPGRILHVTFDAPVATDPVEETVAPDNSSEARNPRVTPDDPDAALAAVIAAHGLHANPGAGLQDDETPAAELGRLLFFDPILSGDKNISCATCHHPALAMADGRVLPIGTGGVGLGPQRRFVDTVQLAAEAGVVRRLAGNQDGSQDDGSAQVGNPFIGQFVPRNSPTILNSALLTQQFWDGRVQSYALTGAADPGAVQVKTNERLVNDLALTDPLAAQALFPVASLHEMAGATFGGLAANTIRTQLLARLQAIPAYVDAFRAIFGRAEETPQEAVTLSRFVEALAAFERRFIYTDAPWDRYVAGDSQALTAQQKRGALLFFGAIDPQVNCAVCHQGDLFTDQAFHNLLVPQLGPGKENGYTGREDWGRGNVTFDARDRYAFRTPSLRNVELTAPYFHTGVFATLSAAIRHHADPETSAVTYDPSANGIPPDLFSSLQPINLEKQGRTVAPELANGLPLDETDIADLAAFLQALTDPAARDLHHMTPATVPSGLPLDELPAPTPAQRPTTAEEDLPSAVEDATAQASAAQSNPVVDETTNLPGTAFVFRDVAPQVGLDFQHGAFRDAIYQDAVAAMGGGLCWLDVDRDGWLDLYLVNSHAEEEAAVWSADGGLPTNVLYGNQAGHFARRADAGADLSMRGNGCVAADFNRDGWTDLYVTAYGPNALLWNNGDGTFREGAVLAGVGAPEWSSTAVVGDLNHDGWPDLFVGGYIDFAHKIPKPSGAFPQDYYGIPDRLFLSLGASDDDPGDSATVGPVTFREVTLEAGLIKDERALGAALVDLDQDGDLDLYIANDGHPNRLYRNDPWPGGPAADPSALGFRLVDVTEQADVGDSGSGMGVATGDYDGDGQVDLFVTNWERELNALYRNELAQRGELRFQYSTFRIGISGLGNGMTGWGTHLADFDHDTDTDLLIINGRVPVTNLATDPEWARYYLNRTRLADGRAGRAGQFLEWTGQVGLKEVGLLLGRGSAVADFDNDGDLDVAINRIAGPVVLLENDLQAQPHAGHWLTVDLQGSFPGARLVVTLPDGRQLVRTVQAGSSYLAGEDPRLHVGLGVFDRVSDVRIVWPRGETLRLENVAADQILRVKRTGDELP